MQVRIGGNKLFRRAYVRSLPNRLLFAFLGAFFVPAIVGSIATDVSAVLVPLAVLCGGAAFVPLEAIMLARKRGRPVSVGSARSSTG